MLAKTDPEGLNTELEALFGYREDGECVFENRGRGQGGGGGRDPMKFLRPWVSVIWPWTRRCLSS